MFNIEHISKSYGKKHILDDISFSVDKGSITGILGVNGSGKSTLLNEIAKKYFGNTDIRFGYLPQENPLMDELKPIDNIKFWCDLTKAQILEELTKSPLSDMGIDKFLDTPVSKMSGGMKKRVSLATVLINKPDIILMDEPFAALDLIARHDVLSYINSFKKSGGSVIITSHEEELFRICDTVYLLKDGKITNTKDIKSGNTGYIDILRSQNGEI